MYRATTSFTTKDYRIKYKEILEDDFTTQEEIEELLNVGYIEVFDGTLEITENGLYDVEDYDRADVSVEGGSASGTIQINSNGTYNVTQYASAEVNVPSYYITDCQYLCSDNHRIDNDSLSIIPHIIKPTTVAQMFRLSSNLVNAPLFDTSNTTDFLAMFYNCSNLETVPLYNTHNGTSFLNMFSGCTKLESVPQFDFTNVTQLGYLFQGCTNLKNVPVFDWSSSNLNTGVNGLSQIFQNCSSLTNDSLNNILETFNTISVSLPSGRLKLSSYGITSEQADICVTLSNWTALSNKGWITGY